MKLKELIEQYGNWDWVETLTPEDGLAMIQIKKPNPRSVWDLKDGDVFWMDEGPRIDFSYWQDLDYENNFRDHGWIFLTKEECEADLERRKVETLLLKYGGRRWFKKGVTNYYLWATENGVGLIIGTTDIRMQGVIYFDSRTALTEAVQQIGSNRIRNALFEER